MRLVDSSAHPSYVSFEREDAESALCARCGEVEAPQETMAFLECSLSSPAIPFSYERSSELAGRYSQDESRTRIEFHDTEV